VRLRFGVNRSPPQNPTYEKINKTTHVGNLFADFSHRRAFLRPVFSLSTLKLNPVTMPKSGAAQDTFNCKEFLSSEAKFIQEVFHHLNLDLEGLFCHE